MTAKSYAGSLASVLKPLGFRREGSDWVRVRGDFREWVNVQTSWLGGATANFAVTDLETERILKAVPCPHELPSGGCMERVGWLIDNYDHWWTKEELPEFAEAVRAHTPAFFDRPRTLEDQITHWYGGRDRQWGYAIRDIPLAIVLYRLGELDEALRILSLPQKKTMRIPIWDEKRDCVRNWVEAQREARD